MPLCFSGSAASLSGPRSHPHDFFFFSVTFTISLKKIRNLSEEKVAFVAAGGLKSRGPLRQQDTVSEK